MGTEVKGGVSLLGTALRPDPKRQGLKDLRCKKRPRDPKAQAAVAAVGGGEPDAICGAEIVWIADPGTAADDMAAAIAVYAPRRAICRRAIVIVVDAIFSPLKDIAHHVVETKTVRRE
jgi:hypothetical protein